MARPNTPQQSRRDDMPTQRAAPRAANLEYPEVAKEYGIEKPLWLALRNMFPTGQDNSIVMVYEYCKVRGLDPLKRPVHIVPMWSSAANAMIDTVMPGIQEMRTTASRTNQYAGQDPVQLGPTIRIPVTNAADAPLDVLTIDVPAYATVTVYKLVQGKRYAFTHTEHFLEAVARERSGRINDMWQKRPIGQLSKCAEAGALRKAFPEELGGEYAAEEMEGREELVGNATVAASAEHGASGIPGPEEVCAGAQQAEAAGDDAGAAAEAEQEGAAEPAEEAQPEPTPEPEKAKPADKPKAEPKAKPAAEAAKPASAPPPSGFKVDLPDGALRVLNSQLTTRGVSEEQLLAKMGQDITVTTINTALGVLKSWGN